MTVLILLLCVLSVLVLVQSFTLSMKVKEASVGNLSRKLKRKIRSADSTSFSNLYTPEFDSYLKNQATMGTYETIQKQLAKKARQLKVTLKSDFGIKAKVVIPNIVETATAAGTFNTLLAACKAANLAGALSGTDQLTVFAPNDEAFAKLGEEKINALLADIPTLTSILQYHVISGCYKSKKITLSKENFPVSLNEKKIAVKVGRDGEITVDGVKIIKGDIKCSNGMVHVIDTVLIPK